MQSRDRHKTISGRTVTPPRIERYFGRGYYHLYRNYLLPAEQTAAEVGFLLRELRPRAGWRWLDLPCGYGRHLVELAAAQPGLRLAGGDLNRAFLREPGLAGTATVAACDMRRLPYCNGCFHVVSNLLNSFGYYPPGKKNGNPQTASRIPKLDDRAVLAEFARVLRPGGRLVLDLANRRALIALVRRQPVIHYLGGEYEAIERFAWDRATEVLRNETLWIWPGGHERARYRLRLYTRGQIQKLLNAAGFEIEKIYGGFNGAPFSFKSDRMLIIAKRI